MKQTKIFKSIALILIAILAVSLLAACSSSQPSPSIAPSVAATETPSASAAPASPAKETKLDQIKKAGVLVIGTEALYPPYEFHAVIDGKDTIVGFDIDLANAIAKELGVQLKIVDMAFDGIIPALQAGQIDIAIAAISPTDERKKVVAFSDIYYAATQNCLIRVADKDKYPTIDSLEGKKIGAQLGALQETIAKEQIKNSKVLALDKVPTLVQELKSKNIEAVICEGPVAEGFVRKNADLMITPFTFKDDSLGSAVALPMDQPELLALINKVIKDLTDNGTLKEDVIKANQLADTVQ